MGHAQTGPLPRLPATALGDPVTLETRILPVTLLAGLGMLLAIQLLHRLV